MPTVDITSQPIVVEAPVETSVVEFTDSTAVVEVPTTYPVVEFGASSTLVPGPGLVGGGYLLGTVYLNLAAATIASLAKADTAVQPGANLSVFVNDLGLPSSTAISDAIAELTTVYQPLDDDLTAIAGMTTTVFGRSFLALAGDVAARTMLGVYSTSEVYTKSEIDAIVTSSVGVWGSITGTLSNQADLQAALNQKAMVNHSHPAAEIVSGVLAPARLGTGTPDITTYLRGDGTWAVSVFDHGALTGLADDDHPQYTALAHNEVISGLWTHTNNLILQTPTVATVGTPTVQSSKLLLKGSVWYNDAAVETLFTQVFSHDGSDNLTVSWLFKDFNGARGDEQPVFSFFANGTSTGYVTGLKIQALGNPGWGGQIKVNYQGNVAFYDVTGTTLSSVVAASFGQGHPSGYTSYWASGYSASLHSFFGNQILIAGGRPVSVYGDNAGFNGNELLNINMRTLVDNPTAANVALRVRGAVSQTANLQEWQNSAGTILASVNSVGDFSTTGTVVGSNLNIANWDAAYLWGNHAGIYEPVLGNPAGDGYVLVSTTAGVRSWIQLSAGGSVTSVALSAPVGFAVTGSPVTSVGTLALAFAAGYSLPTDAVQANWSTAYGWGNHASAGYALASALSGYQPLDADLTAIAGLAGTSGFLKKTAADTWSLDTNSYALSSHNHSGVYEPVLGNPAADGYVLVSTAAGVRSWVAGGAGGVTDHGALTGLADDDHTQYHTDARGDLRYSLLSHTHVIANITDLNLSLYAALADNETVTGDWGFKHDTIGDFMFWRNGAVGAAGIGFRNDDGVKGYIGVDDAGAFSFWDSATTVKLYIDASGNLVADGYLRGTTAGGTDGTNTTYVSFSGLYADRNSAYLKNTNVAGMWYAEAALGFTIRDLAAANALVVRTDTKAVTFYGAVSGITTLTTTGAITEAGTSLASKYAPLSHTHAIADVTGLQTALDGKLALAGGTITGNLTVNGVSTQYGTINAGLGGTRHVLSEDGSSIQRYYTDSVPVALHEYFIDTGTGGTRPIYVRFHQSGVWYNRLKAENGQLSYVGGADDTQGAMAASTFYEGGTALASKYAPISLSTNAVQGSNSTGSRTASATQNVYEEPQYKSGFWEVSGASWTPDTNWWWGLTSAHTSNSGSYNYSGQLAINLAGSEAYFRSIGGGTPNAWRRIWHDANDGSGSGLDADLLDGNHASAFALSGHDHSGVYLPLSGGTMSGALLMGGNAIQGVTGHTDANTFGDGSNYARLVMAQLASTAANLPAATNNANGLIAFTSHAGTGVGYGKQIFFTDSDDLYIRRMSNGAFGTWFKLWHEGNDGASSGLDADLLDGNHASAFALSTHVHAATDITTGTMATARLGSGTANSTTFLRGDGTWAAPTVTVAAADIGAGNLASTVLPYAGLGSAPSAYRVPFLNTTGTTAGNFGLLFDSGSLTYNPSTNTLVAGVFSGSGASLTSLNATNLASGTVPTAQLGSGTPSSTTFLRGDQTWATPAAPAAKAARIYATAGQTVATSAYMTLGGTDFDTDTMKSGNLLYAPVSGYYIITASCRWDTSTTGMRQLEIMVNSVSKASNIALAAGSAGFCENSVSVVAYVASGQGVGAYLTILNTTSKTTANDAANHLSMAYLGG